MRRPLRSQASTTPRSAVLVGLAAAAGAFGATMIMSAATAPAARADEYSDLLGDIQAVATQGQADLGDALNPLEHGNYVQAFYETHHRH